MWKYDDKLSDWDNVESLIKSTGYKPKTSMKTLVANVLLHYEGLAEDDERITMEVYLECGIYRGEECILCDFDYE